MKRIDVKIKMGLCQGCGAFSSRAAAPTIEGLPAHLGYCPWCLFSAQGKQRKKLGHKECEG